MDRAIADAQREWARQRMQTELLPAAQAKRPAPTTPRPAPTTPRPAPTDRTGRRMPQPPAWWRGDEEASKSSLIAAQQLRRGTKR